MRNLIRKIAAASPLQISLFLGCLFTAYFTVALQGIPFEQMEGVARGWNLAAKMSWPDFFYYLLRPVSAALTSSGQHLIDVRVSESMIQKVLYIFWGESMTALLVMNVIAAGILTVLFFRLTFYFTKNKLSSLLAVLFLFTTPAYVWVVMEYGDYSPTDQVFLLSYFFYFFYMITGSAAEIKSKFNFALKTVFLWLLGMVTLNAKEPNKLLLPALSWAVLLFNPRHNIWKPASGKRWPLIAIAVCLFILSLPLVFVEFKGAKPIELSWNGPFSQFFFQPNGWEDEKKMCLFTVERVLPVSVLANFGFFLCWPMLILLALRITRVIRGDRNSAVTPNMISTPLFLGLWLLGSTAFYLFQDSDTFFRYLSWALMPFTIICAVFLTDTVRKISPKFRRITALILCALVIYKITDNFQHSLFFRRQLEKIWSPKWTFQEKVYADYKNLGKTSLFGLYDFWSYDAYAIEQFPYMPPANITAEKLETPEFKAKLKELGKMYFVSYSAIENGPGKITPLAKVDVDRLSFLSAMRANRKKKPASYYYLYRIDA